MFERDFSAGRETSSSDVVSASGRALLHSTGMSAEGKKGQNEKHRIR